MCAARAATAGCSCVCSAQAVPVRAAAACRPHGRRNSSFELWKPGARIRHCEASTQQTASRYTPCLAATHASLVEQCVEVVAGRHHGNLQTLASRARPSCWHQPTSAGLASVLAKSKRPHNTSVPCVAEGEVLSVARVACPASRPYWQGIPATSIPSQAIPVNAHGCAQASDSCGSSSPLL